MQILIEYDSSSGYPGYNVFQDDNYVGHIGGDDAFYFAVVGVSGKDIQWQATLLQTIAHMIEQKPLSKENYPPAAQEPE